MSLSRLVLLFVCVLSCFAASDAAIKRYWRPGAIPYDVGISIDNDSGEKYQGCREDYLVFLNNIAHLKRLVADYFNLVYRNGTEPYDVRILCARGVSVNNNVFTPPDVYTGYAGGMMWTVDHMPYAKMLHEFGHMIGLVHHFYHGAAATIWETPIPDWFLGTTTEWAKGNLDVYSIMLYGNTYGTTCRTTTLITNETICSYHISTHLKKEQRYASSFIPGLYGLTYNDMAEAAYGDGMRYPLFSCNINWQHPDPIRFNSNNFNCLLASKDQPVRKVVQTYVDGWKKFTKGAAMGIVPIMRNLVVDVREYSYLYNNYTVETISFTNKYRNVSTACFTSGYYYSWIDIDDMLFLRSEPQPVVILRQGLIQTLRCSYDNYASFTNVCCIAPSASSPDVYTCGYPTNNMNVKNSVCNINGV